MSGRRELADRVAAGLVAAWEARVGFLPGHALERSDGIVICLTGLADPELNVAFVEREPQDALGALQAAERAFEARGLPLGLDLEPGRHPSVDAAVRRLGLELVVERPMLAIATDALEPPAPPAGVAIGRAGSDEDLAAMAELEARIFGTDPDVAAALYGPPSRDVPGIGLVLAREEGRPVALAWSSRSAGSVGLFGIAVAPEARRRGIGRAVTSFAAREAGDSDLVWLHPTPEGLPLYEAMGFAPVSDREIWVRVG